MPVTFTSSLLSSSLPELEAVGIWQQSQTALPVLPELDSIPFVVEGQAQVVIGQNFDQDVLGDIRTGFQGFVESGQIWALLIGLVIGYMLKGITSSH